MPFYKHEASESSYNSSQWAFNLNKKRVFLVRGLSGKFQWGR